MKYAHLADLHLGSWRDQKMRDLSTKAFLQAIDECIEKSVDFILFAGDIFNTSLPALDTLKIVTKKLKELQEINIPLFVIAGSHDFSPSGKTMIDVLENAGLLVNVCKGIVDPNSKKLILRFVVEPNTGAKITGILGRKGQLDKKYYENLELDSLEREEGYKIFMFHTTLSELKPKHLEQVESHPASFLPKGFDYYAGGHIHHPNRIDLEGYGPMTYPGALFPNNFAEVEKYSHGGYYIITTHEHGSIIEWMPLKVIKHCKISIDARGLGPEHIKEKLLENMDVKDAIVTIRIYGKLAQGKLNDINFKEVFNKFYAEGAYFIMKNTAKLIADEYEEIKISEANPEMIEEKLIKEHLQQIKLFDSEKELSLSKTLLQCLNNSKQEGETITDFNDRILKEINTILNVN
tara:strand:+ start:48607 stop:49824 length:1218 start_codon:yes stop_codon:yes gene_type:complete